MVGLQVARTVDPSVPLPAWTGAEADAFPCKNVKLDTDGSSAEAQGGVGLYVLNF